MGRPAKRVARVRKKDEFRSSAHAINKPKLAPSAGGMWQLDSIYAAIQSQMVGNFSQPSRMAEKMLSDSAIFVAKQNRSAPLESLGVEMVPAGDTSRAQKIAAEAGELYGQCGSLLKVATILDVADSLTDHGVAFTVNARLPREDGSRVDLVPSFWPNEFVRWDSVQQCWMARLGFESGAPHEVPIVHGDGVWTVYKKHEHEPWKHGALAAAALVWARHAFAARDWAKGSVAHGNAKIVGELPEGMRLQDDNGVLTPQADAFIQLLQAMQSDDMPVGIRPAGSKTEFVSNSSNAWQVWSELMLNAEKSAARIYLGTDGVLGSQGGAPGVDIQALFGVATTLVQSDVLALSTGFYEGILEPWTAINFGDSSLAPHRKYMLPDADEAAIRDDASKRKQAFHDDIERTRKNGFVVDDAEVKRIAELHGVDPPKLVPPAAALPAEAPVPSEQDAERQDAIAAQVNSIKDRLSQLTSCVQFAMLAVANREPEVRTEVQREQFDPGPLLAHMSAIVDKQGAIAAQSADAIRSELTAQIEIARADLRRLQDASTKEDGVAIAALAAQLGQVVASVNSLKDTRPLADAKTLTFAERNASFLGDLKDLRALGLALDDDAVKELAERHGVPVPRKADERG